MAARRSGATSPGFGPTGVPEHPAFTAAVGLLAQLPAGTAGAALRTRTVLLEGQIADLEAQRTGLATRLHRLLLLEVARHTS